MDTSIVTTNGSVVIPIKIREKIGIKNGTKIKFVVEQNEIKIIPLTKEIIEETKGLLKSDKSLLKTLMAEKKKSRS